MLCFYGPYCTRIFSLLIFIGDSAYPLSKYLITPFKGELSRQQKEFNRVHSSVRSVVERSIGLLKGRFRRLKHIYCHNLEDICNYVVSACILHNLCIQLNDAPPSDIILSDHFVLVQDLPEDNVQPNAQARQLNIAGRERRDQLLQQVLGVQ